MVSVFRPPCATFVVVWIAAPSAPTVARAEPSALIAAAPTDAAEAAITAAEASTIPKIAQTIVRNKLKKPFSFIFLKNYVLILK